MTREIDGFDTIVTLASWEPRFVQGMKRILDKYRAQRLLVYFVGEYRNQTEENRERLRLLLNEHPGMEIKEQELSFDLGRVPTSGGGCLST